MLQLYGECLERTVLVANRAVGSAAEVYGQVQHVERVNPVTEMARLAALERGPPLDR